MTYPQVIGEFATLDEILAGKSIARFGDGELKCADGKGYSHQLPSEQMAAELLQILQRPHPNCLVGIPTMDPIGPKYVTEDCRGWHRHADRFLRVLNPDVQYYSAFITRPDSAPWINREEYAEKVATLWLDKNIAVLAEKGNSILNAVGKKSSRRARSVEHVRCPRRQAYFQIDKFEADLIATKPDLALLSCGPTATCLAHRLAAKGIHAVDIGSAGGFLMKLLTVKK